MSTFIEKLPSAIDDKVRAAKGADEEVLIQVATDMAGKDRFEKRWLVVTPARLLFLEPNGSGGDVQMSMQS